MKYFLVIISGVIFFAKQALAVCPICTAAVASGVGFSRYLGIDDLISGLWIGGLTVSVIIWTIEWLQRKKWIFRYYKSVTVLGYYALIFLSLYYANGKTFGHPANALAGVDKLWLGTIVGSFVFWAGAEWYFYLKAKNNNRAHFPFQKVAMPIVPLIILSLIYYWLLK